MLLVGTLWLGIVATARAGDNTGLVRLGVGMPAKQSSQYRYAVAGLAVDGNTNQDYYARSCSHTDPAVNALPMFWMVDLQTIYKLERIKIFNRLDCCSATLSDFRVYVGATELTYVEAAHHPGVAGATVKLDLPGLDGRYVKIEKSSSGALMLCEVEIYGFGTTCQKHAGLVRLGVGMPAKQNSQYHVAVAGLAVDGNTNQNFHEGSCSHTLTVVSGLHLFWMVDLQTIYTLERIKIYNRLDCCSEFLSDFRVYVGMTELTYVEAVHHPGKIGSTVELDLSGLYGQYRKKPGNVGTGAVLQSTTVSSSTQCAAICSSLPACRGYNLQLDGAVRVCHILDTAQYATGNGDATFFLRG